MNEDQRIIDFEEKPVEAKGRTISCGIYVIRRRQLAAADGARLILFRRREHVHRRMRRVFLFDQKVRRKTDAERDNESGDQDEEPLREQNLENIRQIDLDLIFVLSHLFQSQ